jgi:hypothetical protein
MSLNHLNVDAFIVRQNIQREIRSTVDKSFARGRADLDAQYFLDLSEDANPSLVDAFQSKSMPTAVREKVGAALACKRYEQKQAKRTYPWQSFHFSRWQAENGFKKVAKELDAYRIIDKDWPYQVQTPGGTKFPCYQYSD